MQQYSGLGGIAYRGEDHVRGVVSTATPALPSTIETLVLINSRTGLISLGANYLAGIFHVADDGIYSYQFFIPVHSGATGGDITVALKSGGFVFESWVLSVPADSRVILSGMNYDNIYHANDLTITLTHSNGSGWSVADTGFFMAELVALL